MNVGHLTDLNFIFAVKFILNPSVSKVQDPDPADFVVRSLWNSTDRAVAPNQSLELDSFTSRPQMAEAWILEEPQIVVMPS